MTEPPIWPPPPNLPEPQSEHDDFLIACIRNSTPKVPLSRLSLAGKLCERTGLNYGSRLAIVNNFCDRHAILAPTHGLVAWSPILLPLFMLTMLETINYVLDQRHDAAVTHMERIMITAEERHMDSLFFGIWAMATVVNIIWAFFRDKRTRKQAAEAREKFAR